jgi:hypothetical protein
MAVFRAIGPEVFCLFIPVWLLRIWRKKSIRPTTCRESITTTEFARVCRKRRITDVLTNAISVKNLTGPTSKYRYENGWNRVRSIRMQAEIMCASF